MKSSYRHTLNIIGVIILIITNFLFFWIGYQNYLYPKLSTFTIDSITEEDSELVLHTSGCHHAVKYIVKFMKDNTTYYQITSDSDNKDIILKDFDGNYNSEYSITVTAYNKNNEAQEANNIYDYIYKDATFDKDIDHYISEDRDLVLSVLGYNNKENYQVQLYYNNHKIYENKVDGEDITISSSEIEGYSGRITAYLVNDTGRIISRFNFYLNTPIVGVVKITSPSDEFKTRWNDINLKYTGGENANHYYVAIYQDNNLVSRDEYESKDDTIFVSASHFNQNTDYTLILEAVYEDYTEIESQDTIHIHIETQETTKPVYVSHDPNYISVGTEITLKSMTSDTLIYYTTDGSNPTTNSTLYTRPITINNDVVIKTFAHTNNRIDSAMNTYSFHVRSHIPVIYISPSNQYDNYGNSDAGYTTEMDIMNRVGTVVINTLKNAGFTVYRNVPAAGIDAWNAQSNAVGADFHLAIHSNGSGTHQARGIEMFVDNETAPALSIASTIYDNLWSIYDGNTNPTYHRGIKYANGSLGEVNTQYLPCGALIEVAYHDQYDDALWVMQNIDKIGQNIANSIISYYN